MVLSRSSPCSLRPCLGTSLSPWTVKFTCFMIIIIISLSLLDLFCLSLVEGFLASSSSFSSSSSSLSLSLALLHDALQHVRFHSAVHSELLRLTSRIVQSGCSFGWIACRRNLRGRRRKNSEPPHAGLLHSFGCLCNGRIVLRLNHSCPSLIHLALFLSTFCLISMRFVFTSDDGPGGALAT